VSLALEPQPAMTPAIIASATTATERDPDGPEGTAQLDTSGT
jgi:hypothetical protein